MEVHTTNTQKTQPEYDEVDQLRLEAFSQADRKPPAPEVARPVPFEEWELRDLTPPSGASMDEMLKRGELVSVVMPPNRFAIAQNQPGVDSEDSGAGRRLPTNDVLMHMNKEIMKRRVVERWGSHLSSVGEVRRETVGAANAARRARFNVRPRTVIRSDAEFATKQLTGTFLSEAEREALRIDIPEIEVTARRRGRGMPELFIIPGRRRHVPLAATVDPEGNLKDRPGFIVKLWEDVKKWLAVDFGPEGEAALPPPEGLEVEGLILHALSSVRDERGDTTRAASKIAVPFDAMSEMVMYPLLRATVMRLENPAAIGHDSLAGVPPSGYNPYQYELYEGDTALNVVFAHDDGTGGVYDIDNPVGSATMGWGVLINSDVRKAGGWDLPDGFIKLRTTINPDTKQPGYWVTYDEAVRVFKWAVENHKREAASLWNRARPASSPAWNELHPFFRAFLHYGHYRWGDGKYSRWLRNNPEMKDAVRAGDIVGMYAASRRSVYDEDRNIVDSPYTDNHRAVFTDMYLERADGGGMQLKSSNQTITYPKLKQSEIDAILKAKYGGASSLDEGGIEDILAATRLEQRKDL